MDAYEYLFVKLQLKFEEQPDTECPYYPWIKRFELYSGSEWIQSFQFRHVQTVKDLFLYLTDPEFSFEEWTTEFRSVVNLLRQFPRDLESKEHVDLLLTLNGLTEEQTYGPVSISV